MKTINKNSHINETLISFDKDPYPGKPRILFIGWAHSSHTHAWLSLLSKSDLNIRFFALPDHLPSPDWQVKTYLTISSDRQVTSVQDITEFKKNYGNPSIRKILSLTSGMPNFQHDPLLDTSSVWPPPQALQYLNQTICSWKPDVIHTLGLNPASYFYFDVLNSFDLKHIGKWIVQARGGPDLELNRLQPVHRNRIVSILNACDLFIADNTANYNNALQLGLSPAKKFSFGIVPGTGGLDIKSCDILNQGPPSTRAPLIIWPKAYECPQSKAMPVFEALTNIVDKIQHCRILMLASTTETRAWYAALPEKLQAICTISERIPHNEVLSIMGRARIMLAPSILDGVPNSLYEAMALGAFPIVSPLKTIKPIVKEEQNVLFARNLYPEEIAQAIERAINDNELVDAAVQRNRQLVNRTANRQKIKNEILKCYSTIKKS